MDKNISGVILAGGANRRFNGIIKAKLVINGRTIISGITDILSGIFEEIIIVTNTPDEFSDYSRYRMVEDEFLKKGPLGGIHAGIKASSKQSVFVFAGDMPFLNKDLIADQIKMYHEYNYDILIPKIGSNIEPLHSLYNVSVTGSLEEYLSGSNNTAVREFIRKQNTGYFNLEASEANLKAFTNVNSSSDLEFLQSKIKAGKYPG